MNFSVGDSCTFGFIPPEGCSGHKQLMAQLNLMTSEVSSGIKVSILLDNEAHGKLNSLPRVFNKVQDSLKTTYKTRIKEAQFRTFYDLVILVSCYLEASQGIPGQRFRGTSLYKPQRPFVHIE